MTLQIRPLESRDHDALKEIYRQAAFTANPTLYTTQQQSAWASQSDGLHAVLLEGQGLVAYEANDQVVAFILRQPCERIALFYCHPEHQRRGAGRQLLRATEAEAWKEECQTLRTEASLISHPLFAQEGWLVSWREELRIAGVPFQRFRMHKHRGR